MAEREARNDDDKGSTESGSFERKPSDSPGRITAPPTKREAPARAVHLSSATAESTSSPARRARASSAARSATLPKPARWYDGAQATFLDGRALGLRVERARSNVALARPGAFVREPATRDDDAWLRAV